MQATILLLFLYLVQPLSTGCAAAQPVVLTAQRNRAWQGAHVREPGASLLTANPLIDCVGAGHAPQHLPIGKRGLRRIECHSVWRLPKPERVAALQARRARRAHRCAPTHVLSMISTIAWH